MEDERPIDHTKERESSATSSLILRRSSKLSPIERTHVSRVQRSLSPESL